MSEIKPKPRTAQDLLPIGALARRTGLSVSAVRFYDDKGLVPSVRSPGGTRLFPRAAIRRLSFILIAQDLGLTLTEIAAELARLPEGRTPTAKDWAAIAARFQTNLDRRIEALQRTKDRLSGCIGCGCLSLKACALYNPEDRAARRGAGPRYALGGDDPDPA